MFTKHLGLVLGALLAAGSIGCARQVKQPPDAAKLYDLGRRLYDDRSYHMAIEMFEASMAKRPDARTAARLADCHERLDHRELARQLREKARTLATDRSR